MMITPLGAEGGCHVSVMVVKVSLRGFSPFTGPGAKWIHFQHLFICH